MKSLTLLLFFPLLSAMARPVTAVLHPKIQTLQEYACFQDWREQLEIEGYEFRVKILKSEKIKTSEIDSWYIPEKRGVLIFIGPFSPPQLVIKNHEQARKKMESVLPLLHPTAPFPSFGQTNISKDFYSQMRQSVGFISGGEKNSIQDYCLYLKKNLKYRTCEKGETLRAKAVIGPDWDKVKDRSKATYRELTSIKLWPKNSSWKSRHLLELLKSPRMIDYAVIAKHSSAKEHLWDWDDADHHAGDFDRREIRKLNPSIRFLNLFACNSGESLGQTANLAQTYLLETDHVLGVIAPSVKGGMRAMGMFHDLLLSGQNWGDAFRLYLAAAFTYAQYDPRKASFEFAQFQGFNLDWEAGLIFFGDPTLQLFSCIDS